MLGLSIAVGLVASGCGAPAAVAPSPTFVGTQVDRPTPASVLRLPLTTADGQTVTLGTFGGEFVVLADVMTLGQETSPLNTSALVRAARAVQDAGLDHRVRFVSVTIDPRRDTAKRLATYRRLYADAPADWTLLTGSPQMIDAFWNYFGVHRTRVPEGPTRAVDWLTLEPLTYTLVHNDQVHFLDPTHHDRFILGGPARVNQADKVPAVLDTFLNGTGRHDLTDPALTAWSARQVLNVLGWLTGRKIPSAPG